MDRGSRGRGGSRGGDRGARGGSGDRGGRAGYDRGGRGGSADRGGRGGRGDFRGRGDFGDRGRGRGDFGGRGGFRGGGGGGRGGSNRPRPAFGLVPSPRELAEIYNAGHIAQPDSRVTQLENQIEKALTTTKIASLSLDERPPVRPGYGTRGQPVTLWANYLELAAAKETTLYRYSIVITPEVTGKKANRVVQLLMTEGKISAMGSAVTTDFKSNIIACEQLRDDMCSDVITYRMELEDEPPANPVQYKILIEQTGAFTLSDLLNYVTSSQAGAMLNEKEDFIQALNIALGYGAKADPTVLSIGANRHYRLEGRGGTEPAYKDLAGAVYAWRGFFMSVRTATSRLLLNVNPKAAALCESGPLQTVMLHFGESSRNVQKLNAFLSMIKIEISHLPERKTKNGDRIPRIKTIADVATPRDGMEMPNGQRPQISAWGAKPNQIKFFLNNDQGGGSYVTVETYFKQKYGIVCDNSFPVVNVGTKGKPNYLIAEVCTVRPGQLANGKLDGNQTTDMLGFAALRPHQNAELITKRGIDSIGLGSMNSTLSRFNLSLASKELITVPGRILASPNVMYRQNKSARTQSGTWNMRDIKFHRQGKKGRWTAIWLDNGPGRAPWGSFGDFKNSTLRAFYDAQLVNGVELEMPFFVTADNERPTGVLSQDGTVNKEAINNLMRKAKEGKADLVLVILNRADGPTYNAVKTAGEIKFGVNTVCAVAEKISKPAGQLQFFANEALKFNLKLGGQNQVLEPKKLGIIGEGKTMVVGLDVTHPSPGSADKAPSVAAIVASIDKYLAQFPAELSVQEGRKEMIADLTELLKSRFALWKKHNNGQLPENILVYRDGVSEGQYDLCRNIEIPAMRKACNQAYPATAKQKGLPRMTFIIVGKRHHTRFYPTVDDDKVTDVRSGNPKNGTIVDRGVTDARMWDYYLQAHTGLQGTARPAHYVVILDEIFRGRPIPPGSGFKNTADVLEDLTHNMCYLFGRATKAVSLCPASYYADLACARARCYLSGLYDPLNDVPSDSQSTISGNTGVSGGNVRIHPDIKDTMFYV